MSTRCYDTGWDNPMLVWVSWWAIGWQRVYENLINPCMNRGERSCCVKCISLLWPTPTLQHINPVLLMIHGKRYRHYAGKNWEKFCYLLHAVKIFAHRNWKLRRENINWTKMKLYSVCIHINLTKTVIVV